MFGFLFQASCLSQIQVGERPRNHQIRQKPWDDAVLMYGEAEIPRDEANTLESEKEERPKYCKVVATQIFLMFTPIWGNDPIRLINIFQMGWFNHQLESLPMTFLVRGFYSADGLGCLRKILFDWVQDITHHEFLAYWRFLQSSMAMATLDLPDLFKKCCLHWKTVF